MSPDEQYFILIGIDPGTDKLGLAYFKVQVDTLEILETQAMTFIATKMVRDDSWLAVMHSYRTARISKLKEVLLKKFNNLQPSVIACESPFFDPRRPGAFQPLVEILDGIRNTVIEYSVWQPLFMIDPSSIKNSVKAPGNADKDKMKICVLALTDLKFNGDTPLEQLDEHSIDAIAVAYCQLKHMKKQSGFIT